MYKTSLADQFLDWGSKHSDMDIWQGPFPNAWPCLLTKLELRGAVFSEASTSTKLLFQSRGPFCVGSDCSACCRYMNERIEASFNSGIK